MLTLFSEGFNTLESKREKTVRQTYTLKGWHSFKVGGYNEVEWACDYYYKDGKLVGCSDCYYTGRYR
jgi:hypothetical protein